MDVHAGIIADSKSGVTGAGRKPSDKLHFPEVNENLRAYGIFHHRHLPEMLQELALSPKDFIFTPHLLPITRGILTTIYLRLSGQHSLSDVEKLFQDFYAAAPMVGPRTSCPVGSGRWARWRRSVSGPHRQVRSLSASCRCRNPTTSICAVPVLATTGGNR